MNEVIISDLNEKFNVFCVLRSLNLKFGTQYTHCFLFQSVYIILRDSYAESKKLINV